jgi:hypothetical protein
LKQQVIGSNRSIEDRPGLPRTVEIHRARVMEKTSARSHRRRMEGELSAWEQAMLPLLAVLGGMKDSGSVVLECAVWETALVFSSFFQV